MQKALPIGRADHLTNLPDYILNTDSVVFNNSRFIDNIQEKMMQSHDFVELCYHLL